MRNKTLLKKIKAELSCQFDNLISRVILFGSRMDKTARKSSDYDVLIVLNEQISWQDKDKILDVITEMNLKYELIIDAHIISVPELHTIKGRQPYILKALETGLSV